MLPDTPEPGQRLKARDGRPLEAASPGGLDDRRGERMLARLLESGGELEHVGLGERSDGGDAGHARPALGQRAGLVDDERVDLLQPLERLGVPDQHARRARRDRCRP